MAGVPLAVLRAAKKHLAKLEQDAAGRSPQGDLFSAPAPRLNQEEQHLRQALHELDPDALSPKAAHELLYRLKGIADHRD